MAQKIELPTRDEVYNNFLRAYRLMGSPKSNNWYGRQKEHIREVAEFLGISTKLLTGLVAVTSPNNGWYLQRKDGTEKYPNLDGAIQIAVAYLRGEHMEKGIAHIGTMTRNRKKAWKMMETGKVFPHLSGQKVIAFFQDLMDARSNSVVVDRHVIKAGINNFNATKKEIMSLSHYRDFFREVLYELARDEDIEPSGLQATIWEYAKLQSENAVVDFVGNSIG